MTPISRTLVGLMGAFALTVGNLAVGAEVGRRPNILWISIEDASPNLGCYGDAQAKTPVLDALAKESVRYTHAFSVAPVCAPSRSSIITGVHPTSLGTHPMRCQGAPTADTPCFTEALRRKGYYCTNNVKTDYNFPVPPQAWDANSATAHWKNRPAGAPFFSIFNLTTTHESQIRLSDKEFAERTKELTHDERHDPADVDVPAYHPDSPVVRRDWARYYDLVTVVDKQVGRLLKELEAAGLADDTIVFFFSDHGVGLPRGKRWLYDSGTRVPLLVRTPEAFRSLAGEAWAGPGTTTDRLVCLMDLGPTVQSLAGLKPSPAMDGRAFLGPKTAAPREYVFQARDRMDERYDMVRAVRDGRYRYIRNYYPSTPYAQPLAYMDEMPTTKEWRALAAAGKLSQEAG
ncbi:MAG: sulfatase family protein, partial [Planctomycetia bacterium]